jgi:hypothetical protein
VELPFRINFSAKQKVERLRIPHHLKAAERWQTVDKKKQKIEILKKKYEK